jgi:hypothetical protein
MKTAMARIDEHLRTLMRVIIWKQWKVPTKRKWGLQKLGVPEWLANKTSQWGDHYIFIATKSCLKRAVSKEIGAVALSPNKKAELFSRTSPFFAV